MTIKNEVLKQTKSLFISAGHDDVKQGAYGNGYTEADIVLPFRDKLATALRDRVVFGKDGDSRQNLPLREAVQMAKVRDVAVEFHCNSYTDRRATGVETLSGPKHKALGERLCEEISRVLNIENRGAKGENAGPHSRLAFVRDGGGIIVEMFFITNPFDLKAYLKRKEVLVEAVARVLIDEVCRA